MRCAQYGDRSSPQAWPIMAPDRNETADVVYRRLRNKSATSTAGQPAPKLKRIKEEEEMPSPKLKSSSRRSFENALLTTIIICFSTNFAGEESSRKQIRKVVTLPSSANGHVPHENTANNNSESGSTSSESGSTSSERSSEDDGIGTHDNVEPLTTEENAGSRASVDDTAVTTEKETVPENRASSVQENHLNRDESQSLVEGALASDPNTSHSKVTVDEQPVAMITSTPVGDEDVPGSLAGDGEKPEAIEEKPSEAEADIGTVKTDVAQNKATSEVSLSAEKETVPALDQTNTTSVTAPDNDSVAADTDLGKHSVASEVSLSGEKETAPTLDQTNRTSVTAPGNDSVAADTDLAQHRAASEVSLSAEKETASTPDQTNTTSVTAPDTADIDVAQHTDRAASEVSLSGENNNTAPVVVDQTKRDSVTASEHSAAPSDNEVNMSRHHRGSSELESVSPTATEDTQPSQPREPSKEDSVSLGGKESLNDQKIEHDSVSSPAESAEASKEDYAAVDRKDSVDHTAATSDDFKVKSESIRGRICTLSASVLIGSLDDPQGERTVTLTGSVYRVPCATTPKPGEKSASSKGMSRLPLLTTNRVK
ncbi:hypothetical protein OS493_001842 [Desmophyllum pertusum]|uniref:Uncharacterized protein n=1 Tax=Desmophyllum pertusum TaxID=174260 RepID=A0A9W9Z4E3_9CNID|nr:hypothetical protein OS493_001842 [Desmophyllum pertusum]